MTAPAPSPDEAAIIDRFGIFDEERVVEEVARAIWADQYPFDHWDSTQRGQRDHYRRLAVAAVAAYRATIGGRAEDAVRTWAGEVAFRPNDFVLGHTALEPDQLPDLHRLLDALDPDWRDWTDVARRERRTAQDGNR